MFKAHYDFANRWGDESAIQNFRTSTKSKEVIILNCENALKDMAQRFERSPMGTTISWWAKDLVEIGCDDLILKEVLKSVPLKFERCPTLAQLMELLRPYLYVKSDSESELDKYTKSVFSHAKAKFEGLVGSDAIARMVTWYKKEIFPNSSFNDQSILMCIVNDWVRAYCPNHPQKIIDQAKLSNTRGEENDIGYFLNPLKRYAQENNLQI
jgi:hypothetical protein